MGDASARGPTVSARASARLKHPGRVVAGLAAALLIPASCGRTHTASPPVGSATPTSTAEKIFTQEISQPFARSGRPKLQFVGDSITALASPAFDAHFRGRYDVAIDAVTGYDTYLMAGSIQREAVGRPDIEVVNLGTNDALRVTSSLGSPASTPYEPVQTVAAIEARYQMIAHEFPGGTCVVFVTINSHNPSWGPAPARALDRYLRAHFPHIADWDRAWSASYFPSPDDPHPNARGNQALVQLIDRAIATCPSPTGSSTTQK